MSYNVLNVENQSTRVDQHLRYIATGRYGLPEFQRTFVWDDDRVRRLWDSLYRGFPVGQIMLWMPDDVDFPMRSFGREQKEIPTANRVAVIDGQQRLTALYLVLIGTIPLRFDLDRNEFTFNSGANDLRLDILRNTTLERKSSPWPVMANAPRSDIPRATSIPPRRPPARATSRRRVRTPGSAR